MTHYTEMQLDALRELANIGSGTASTALSSMLGRSVDITVPRLVGARSPQPTKAAIKAAKTEMTVAMTAISTVSLVNSISVPAPSAPSE